MSSVSAPSDLNLTAVSALHTQLTDKLADEHSCTLDLSDTAAIDAAGAQFLLAAHRAGVVLRSISPPLRTTLELLGVWDELEDSQSSDI